VSYASKSILKFNGLGLKIPSHKAALISTSPNVLSLHSVPSCFGEWRHGHSVNNTTHITTAEPTFGFSFSASVKCGVQDSIPGRELTRKRVGLGQLRDCDVTDHAQCVIERINGSGPPEDRSKQGKLGAVLGSPPVDCTQQHWEQCSPHLQYIWGPARTTEFRGRQVCHLQCQEWHCFLVYLRKIHDYCRYLET
jgi:hypothetical protein